MIYFYGEDSNLTAIFHDHAPDVPAGYGFDYVNADALIHELSASGGQIRTRSGMSYRVLALDKLSKEMSLPVLRAIHALVRAGAVVAGDKPDGTPSLADDAAEFKKLNDELFGDGTGVHSVGAGRVYAHHDAAAALKALGIAPDFDYSKNDANTKILFAHRRIKGGEIYFLDNRGDKDAQFEASFRVGGLTPELWRAETGQSEAVSYKIDGGRTSVPLHLEPWGTVFVVFRKPAQSASVVLPPTVGLYVGTIEGEWNVSFQAGRGAPATARMDKLIAWNESADQGIKYFSGTGDYTTTFPASTESLNSGAKLWIDLGDVKNLAEVTLNGKPLGVVWHAPYRVDATNAVKQGTNELTVKVTNAWVNRMIGDEQPGATKITFADVKPYKADSPLLPSGLLGPVRLVSVTKP